METHKKKMKELMDKYASLRSLYNPPRLDRDTRERLRSLGYVSSPPVQIVKKYGPEDDLKTLLPFQQRKAAAMMMLERYLFLNDKTLSPEERKKIEELIVKCKS